MRLFSVTVSLIAIAMTAVAQAHAAPHQSIRLQLEYETSSENSDGKSTGSSSGRQALVETVIDETSEGVILNYDLPRDEDGKTNSNFWYFPAQLLERPDGTVELLDLDGIEARIEQWLQDWKFPRETCGLWSHGGGFPYKVDCDPQSILDQIEPFDLRIHGLLAGAEYSHSSGSSPGILEPLPAPRSGYSVTVSIDQAKAQAAEVESELTLAQMLGKDITREQAESNAAKIAFEGSIIVEFDLNALGTVIRMTERTEVNITRPDDGRETKKSLVTVERHDMAPAKVEFGA